MSKDATAIVDPSAEIGEGVVIHPYTIIEAGVQIGDGCEIGPHAVIRTGTRMGRNNRITIGAVLGDFPQDRKFDGEESYLQIGDNNHIREYVTLHRATGEGEATVIGDDNMLMAYCHIGHNSRIGNNIMIANCVQCSGHTQIDDFAVLGGMAGLHQFVRVGTMCMVAAMAMVRIDAPHYMLVAGSPARPRNINVIGMRRRGVSKEAITAIRHAYRLLYRSDLNTGEAIAQIRETIELLPEVENLLEFVESIPEGERGRQLN